MAVGGQTLLAQDASNDHDSRPNALSRVLVCGGC